MHHRPCLHVLRARGAVAHGGVPARRVHLQDVHEGDGAVLLDRGTHLVDHRGARLPDDHRLP
ncbi:MAG: hypothetical protein ACK559_23070, partial [bacterium]